MKELNHTGDQAAGEPAESAHALSTLRRVDDLAALMRSRRSVRQYQDIPVPHDLLHQMIEAARWAPSPHGRQPWRFAVLTRTTPKQQLADAMGQTWQQNLEMDGQAPDIVALRMEKSRQRILQAPAIILPCLYLEDLDQYPDAQRQADEKTMAVQSIGAAIQNMLLTAYELGLDTGWMCAPLFCPEVACAALDLDSRLIPQALITVGYAAADPKRRPRLPLDSLIVRFD
ncbi:nitroreductase family protein [Dictyobacter arantiisoli]|uniref:Nitroreductase n=1 Tax=Dictyobacter arantiisoli TaxID=2014874 RepID=A0A5A5TEJ8_9CHLR|nr:nitroreductase family protein [Dictyobacter arantiisoli]GCF09503.1 nitroreductase [Dictyobacter arantiisoli]